MNKGVEAATLYESLQMGPLYLKIIICKYGMIFG
jgi:hypothetical protein